MEAAAPAPAATQPAVAQGPSQAQIDAAQMEFNALETDFGATAKQPLDQQPAAELQAKYAAVVRNDALPDAMKRTADFRLAVLKVRIDAQHRLEQVRKAEADAAAKTLVLKAEKEELQQRLEANKVDVYSAVGTLQPSSLQFGAETLFRLTDPANGRTVVYLRGNSADAMKLMGRFVGVRGDAVTDDRLSLRVIPFTEIAPVEVAQVNNKVSANIVPPSLVPHAAQASVGNP